MFIFVLSGLFCCLGFSVVIFFAVWAGGGWGGGGGGAFLFFAVWAGGVLFFFAVWAGACSFCCCLGGGVFFFFAVWAGGVFFFLLFGRETGAHSLTRLPGSSLSDPTTKETERQKKKTRVPTLNPKHPDRSEQQLWHAAAVQTKCQTSESQRQELAVWAPSILNATCR